MKVVLPALIEFLRSYLGTKLQRTASLVVFIGLGLITVSYNEVIMKYIFVPVGFNIDGRKPVFLGFILIVLGLTALILDKFAEKTKPITFEQDRNLVKRIQDILPWHEIDSFLNNISNLYYTGENSKAIYDLRYFLDNEAHKFENKKLNEKCDNLLRALSAIRAYMGQNFVGPEPVGTDFFKWIVDRSVDENNQHSELYWRKIHELTTIRTNLEDSYKGLLTEARKLGMVTLEKF